jgi:hypothetical protein
MVSGLKVRVFSGTYSTPTKKYGRMMKRQGMLTEKLLK